MKHSWDNALHLVWEFSLGQSRKFHEGELIQFWWSPVSERVSPPCSHSQVSIAVTVTPTQLEQLRFIHGVSQWSPGLGFGVEGMLKSPRGWSWARGSRAGRPAGSVGSSWRDEKAGDESPTGWELWDGGPPWALVAKQNVFVLCYTAIRSFTCSSHGLVKLILCARCRARVLGTSYLNWIGVGWGVNRCRVRGYHWSTHVCSCKRSLPLLETGVRLL